MEIKRFQSKASDEIPDKRKVIDIPIMKSFSLNSEETQIEYNSVFSKQSRDFRSKDLSSLKYQEFSGFKSQDCSDYTTLKVAKSFDETFFKPPRKKKFCVMETVEESKENIKKTSSEKSK